LQLSQLYFPLWKLAPAPGFQNGEMLGISSENLIQASLSTGRHHFALMFDGGLSERAGDIETGASILLALSGLILAASRSRMRKAA
jgi:hypothetical protein